MNGLENTSYEEWLRELGLFILEETREGLYSFPQLPERWFLEPVSSALPAETGLGRIALNCVRGHSGWTLEKYFSLLEWSGVEIFPREVVESPSLQVFKRHMELALGDLVVMGYSGDAGWTAGLDDLKGFFQP